MKESKIGYIGLGIMGKPAASNLLKKGHHVNVWGRKGRQTTQELIDLGATECLTLETLAKESDIIITNVSDTVDVVSLMGADEGIGKHLTDGQLIIDMSTISPSVTTDIAMQLKAKGVDFLDAPVSGGEKGAIEGTLTFMVGGEQLAFDRALPVFNAMGKIATRIGQSGAGQVAKMCNQIIIGATLMGVSEAFHLAKHKGVDLTFVRQALQGGFAGSRVLDIHAKRMIDDDFTPGFKAILHKKDIGIALEEGHLHQLPLKSAQAFYAQLSQLMDNGDGEKDSSAIFKLM